MIAKLQYITDSPALAEIACKAGCKWIQFRIKDTTYSEWKNMALQFKKICVRYNATLIINDNPEIAMEVLAEGVHLGKQDMSPEKARNLLGDSFIIGATANTFEDIQAINLSGADYIGLGPYRFTDTKKNLSPLLGLEGYEKIMQQCRMHNINLPVIAIGGIKKEDIKDLFNTGIYGIAVSSAISNASDPGAETLQLLEAINNISETIKLQSNHTRE
ncbi:MAG: thiamine phosphate synthase [Cytophagaceae bacterium]|nr:thiamine phosphate synthase [Cytophagaceae bacterium]MDW8456894.1 thiamine phosphate synthase [Cytophagaceae bacterium]